MQRVEISLPAELKSLLETTSALESGVSVARRDFGPILSANRLTFFPEYTDHGIQHIEDVIRTSHALMTDAARAMLTVADASTLVLSVILHDLAMHLGKDGFILLVTGQSGLRSIPWFKDHEQEKDWVVLWRDFLSEAPRFSSTRNEKLFGTPNPIGPPKLDVAADWTEKQFLLVGEFIRRHHGRLAHEMAMHGFPGTSKDRNITLDESLGAIRDLSGVVARSHSISLRTAVDYLSSEYSGNARIPKNVHAPFLMAALRVADFLQVQAERASKQVMQTRTLRSPVSLGEWKVHHAIDEVHQAGDDHESVTINASPQDVETFLKIKTLTSGLQRELDHSWAVLGEVYGPRVELHALGLAIRRVRSNLDDLSTFAKKSSFVPTEAAFEAADAELLSLLIAPLYGDEPNIGVRELMQNAVDAVRELEDHLSRNPTGKTSIEKKRVEQDADVLISVRKVGDAHFLFSISDRGRGMSSKMVKDYFLRAGASFRMSDAWRKEFEDETGHSRVLRSGRFGVGALAAFLIGDEIDVTTRSYDEDSGIQFTAKLSTNPIQLNIRPDLPIGTTIRIKLSEETYDSLAYDAKSWDWFRLSWPKVEQSVDGKKVEADRPSLPLKEGMPTDGWYRLPESGFDELHWGYNDAPGICCNGIVIGEVGRYGNSRFHRGWSLPRSRSAVSFDEPSLSVFDADGKLPLTLDRLGLQHDNLPFNDSLLRELALDLIAYAFTTAPYTSACDGSAAAWYYNKDGHPGLRGHPGMGGFSGGACWVSNENGIFPADLTLLQRFTSGRILCFLTSNQKESPLRPPEAQCTIVRFSANSNKGETIHWFRSVFYGSDSWLPGDVLGTRMYLGKSWVETRKLLTSQPMPKTLVRSLTKQGDVQGKAVIFQRGDADFKISFPDIWVGDDEALSDCRVAEIVVDTSDQDPLTVLGSVWCELLGGPLPFDEKSRTAILEKIGSKLEPYLARWQSQKERLLQENGVGNVVDAAPVSAGSPTPEETE